MKTDTGDKIKYSRIHKNIETQQENTKENTKKTTKTNLNCTSEDMSNVIGRF